jgi:23S rRNA (guanosine2251-2'-O)-methyltransferase
LEQKLEAKLNNKSNHKLNSTELSAVKQTYLLLKNYELQFRQTNQALSQKECDHIKASLSALQKSESLFLQKLADLQKHINPQMSLRTLNDLLVPFERQLDRNTTDADFLITSTDKTRSEHLPGLIPLHLVLDNLRSAFNVGNILRTSEALGIEKVYLSGYTATPENDKTARASLGAENHVDWSKYEKTEDLLLRLKSEGFWIVALETTTSSQPVEQSFQMKKTVFVLGNERFGLEQKILQLCHEVRHIPMHGFKNSLNVGIAAAIGLYEWRRQWMQSR